MKQATVCHSLSIANCGKIAIVSCTVRSLKSVTKSSNVTGRESDGTEGIATVRDRFLGAMSSSESTSESSPVSVPDDYENNSPASKPISKPFAPISKTHSPNKAVQNMESMPSCRPIFTYLQNENVFN